MQLTNILALFIGLAAASPISVADGPSSNQVQIISITSAGTGCRAGTVSIQLAPEPTALVLLYANFIAQAGNDNPPDNYRSNCQLSVRLKYPPGWQFSISKTNYRGYAKMPAGITGTCKAIYYFSGDPKQVRFYHPPLFSFLNPRPLLTSPSTPLQSASTLTTNGPFDDNLNTAQLDVTSPVWSPCGVEGVLNIASEIRLSPMDATKPVLLAVRSPGAIAV